MHNVPHSEKCNSRETLAQSIAHYSERICIENVCALVAGRYNDKINNSNIRDGEKEISIKVGIYYYGHVKKKNDK